MLKRRLNEPFGKAGLTVAILALVFAAVGGAYAATKLNTTQKKEVEKIAKKYAGKPGAPGANGTNGTNGAAGAKGEAGTNGTNGTDGTSATTATFAGVNGGCAEGGIEVKSASPTVNVCNGVKGTTGFTETLPSGKTETGTWSIFAFGVEVEGQPASVGAISFPIPLATKGEAGKSFVFSKVKTEKAEFGASGCTGTVAAPTAPKGTLCVYTSDEEFVAANGPVVTREAGTATANTFGRSGAVLTGIFFGGEPTAPAQAVLAGSWAVTAP